jgi:hypothetical protein
MGDLDVLVPVSRLRSAATVLRAAGWGTRFWLYRYWDA